ncbi:MAG: hypothetical protein KAJ19_03220 [Gammaproteobacteria bacterium]|nr:hypothetical protein [Gammaproteobacteria bacterium]
MWTKGIKKVGLVLLAIVGGIVAVLGIVFALKYEKQKIGRVKGDAIIRKAESDISSLEKSKGLLLKAEMKLETEEKIVDMRMQAKKDEIAQVKIKVEEMDDVELSNRFNELYRSG